MSARALNRVEVLGQVSQGWMTATKAANVLGLGLRQVHRFLKTVPTDGPAAIRHNAPGQASNNRIDPFAAVLIRDDHAKFGPTCAAEKLEEDHGLKVFHELLRKWMIEADLRPPRKERRKFHRSRLRRKC